MKLYAIIAAFFGAIATLFTARKSGKDAVIASQAKDAAKRTEKGRKAAGKARDDLRDGKSPDEVVRGNDGAWE